jgi:hypothetical protein
MCGITSGTTSISEIGVSPIRANFISEGKIAQTSRLL